MTPPYYSVCLKCKTNYRTTVASCLHCGTDEYLLDYPFEEKDRA